MQSCVSADVFRKEQAGSLKPANIGYMTSGYRNRTVNRNKGPEQLMNGEWKEGKGREGLPSEGT